MHDTIMTARWWQLKYFCNFHPENCGRWTHFHEHIFQMGGSTTQLAGIFWWCHGLKWPKISKSWMYIMITNYKILQDYNRMFFSIRHMHSLGRIIRQSILLLPNFTLSALQASSQWSGHFCVACLSYLGINKSVVHCGSLAPPILSRSLSNWVKIFMTVSDPSDLLRYQAMCHLLAQVISSVFW